MKTTEEYSYERGKQHLLTMLCEFFPGLLDEEEAVDAENLVTFLREIVKRESAN